MVRSAPLVVGRRPHSLIGQQVVGAAKGAPAIKLCLSVAYLAFFFKVFISYAKLGGLLLFDLANIKLEFLLVELNCSNVVGRV